MPGNPPLLASVQAVPHGIVHHQVYYSRVRGGDAGMWVYTPPAYDPRSPAVYPVVYLLHGFGDREEAWIDAGHANTIVDNLIAQGRISPVIVVMPYGHPVPVEERSFSKDYSERNLAAMEKDVLGDLIPVVERDYRADARAEKRAIVGLSMGGGQSLTIGLGHPGTFRWVGAFSAAAPESNLEKTFADVIADPAGRPHLVWIAVGKDDFLLKRNEAIPCLAREGGHRPYLDGERGRPRVAGLAVLSAAVPRARLPLSGPAAAPLISGSEASAECGQCPGR